MDGVLTLKQGFLNDGLIEVTGLTQISLIEIIGEELIDVFDPSKEELQKRHYIAVVGYFVKGMMTEYHVIRKDMDQKWSEKTGYFGRVQLFHGDGIVKSIEDFIDPETSDDQEIYIFRVPSEVKEAILNDMKANAKNAFNPYKVAYGIRDLIADIDPAAST